MLTKREAAEQLDMLAGGMKPGPLSGALRTAEKLLREEPEATPLTVDEIRTLMDGTCRGREYALYIEDRGYYKMQAVIMDSANGNFARVIYANGMRYMLDINDYNRTWRLWSSYPSGIEMKKSEWRARK